MAEGLVGDHLPIVVFYFPVVPGSPYLPAGARGRPGTAARASAERSAYSHGSLATWKRHARSRHSLSLNVFGCPLRSQPSWYVVGARTGGEGFGGISLFVVPADAPGFSRTAITNKMGWWCSDTATLHFDGCRIPERYQLGQEGLCLLAIMDNFNYERLTLSAGCLGMAKRCLDDAITYAQQRETFGKPLIKHQAIRHKIADMSGRIDALDAYLQMVAWRVNEATDKGAAMPAAELAKIKVFASKTAEFCANEAMQILGGAGYLRGCAVERIYREVKVMAIGGGSEEIMRDLAVRQMGL